MTTRPALDECRSITNACEEHIFSVNWAPEATIIATGSFGRMQMCPGSDVDMLILAPKDVHEILAQKVTVIWQHYQPAAVIMEASDVRQALLDNYQLAASLYGSRVIAGESESAPAFALTPHLASSLKAEINQRATDHTRIPEGYLHLKNSPGMLRDVQALRILNQLSEEEYLHKLEEILSLRLKAHRTYGPRHDLLKHSELEFLKTLP